MDAPVVCRCVCMSSPPAKMSQLREKDSKINIVVAESGKESPAGFKEPVQEGKETQAYTHTNKTWKFLFWSSENPNLSIKDRTTTC